MAEEYMPGFYGSRECSTPRILDGLRSTGRRISAVRARDLRPPIDDSEERIKDCCAVLSFATESIVDEDRLWQPMIAFVCGESQAVSARELLVPPSRSEDNAFHESHRLGGQWLAARGFVAVD